MPYDNVIQIQPRLRTAAPIAPDALARIYSRPPIELPKVIRFEPLNFTPTPGCIWSHRFDRWTRRFGLTVAVISVGYFAAQMFRAYLAGRL